MAVTWSRVSALAPALAAIPVLTQAEILAHVAVQLDEVALGDRYDTASLYLAAHLGTLVLRDATGPGGPVASESVGEASRSYAVFSPMGSDAVLDSTPWGKEFRRLCRVTCGGPRVL